MSADLMTQFMIDTAESNAALARKLHEEFKAAGPRELSESEKFAVAIIGGARIESSDIEGNSMTFKTEKCGISWDGERFIVALYPRVTCSEDG